MNISMRIVVVLFFLSALAASQMGGCVTNLNGIVDPMKSMAVENSWVLSAGAPNNSVTGYSLDLGPGPEGYSYFGGTFRGSVSIGGGAPLTSNGYSDCYVSAVDGDGNVVWQRSFGTNQNDHLYAVCSDLSGNLYVTGTFLGSLTIDSQTISSTGYVDIFVARFKPGGALDWLIHGGSPVYDTPRAMDVDSNGNLYLTGATPGAFSMGTQALPHAGDNDIWFAKIDQAGSVVWLRHAGGPGSDFGTAVEVGRNGNIYLAASFSSEVDFGSDIFRSHGDRDISLMSWTPAGDLTWAAQFGGPGADDARGIVANSSAVYINAQFDDRLIVGSRPEIGAGEIDIALIRVDSNTGATDWIRTAGGADSDAARNMTMDSHGNVIITGVFTGAMTLGNIGLKAVAGSVDIFVAAYTSGGDALWARSAGGDGFDIAMGVEARGDDLFLTGTFRNSSTFGAKNLTALGTSDAFLWKFTSPVSRLLP